MKTREEALALLTEWRAEQDPPADGWRYADLMADILADWAPLIPENRGKNEDNKTVLGGATPEERDTVTRLCNAIEGDDRNAPWPEVACRVALAALREGRSGR